MNLSVLTGPLMALIVFCTFISVKAYGADPKLSWFTHESDHFLVHYPEPLKSYVSKVTQLAENSHKELSPFINWTPKKKTHVVLLDEFDQANGYATPMPNNTIVLYMQPPTSGELLQYYDWLSLLIHHEYTHTLHIDKALHIPNDLRSLFGRFIFLFPNALHPNWFQEGLATYLETDEEFNTGRGTSDYYQMMMRSELQSGLKPLSRINHVHSHDWPFNTAYLYGVYFFRFIADVYGEKAINQLVDNYSENIIPYRVSSNPEAVTGKDLETLWYEFSEYLRGYFAPQFQRLNAQSYSARNTLSDGFITMGNPAVVSDKKVWFSAVDRHLGSGLYKVEQANQRVVTRVVKLNSLAAIDVNDNDQLLISQLEQCDQYRLNYDLYWFDQNQHQAPVKLTDCARYRMAKWLPTNTGANTAVALAYDKGIPRLDVLKLDTKKNKAEQQYTLWQGQMNEVISSFDINEKGQVVASIKFEGDHWNVYRLNTLASLGSGKKKAGKKAWSNLTNDTQQQIWPSWHKGNVHFVQANLGQFELYKLDNKNSGGSKVKKQRLTHNFTGIQQYDFLNDETIASLYYTGEGFELVSMALNEKPALYEKQWPKPKLVTSALSNANSTQLDPSYSPWPTVLPTYWFPVYLKNEKLNEVGFFTSGNDALSWHQYQLQLTYEKTNETPLLNAQYTYDNRYTLAVQQSMGTTNQKVNNPFTNTVESVYKYSSQWVLNVTKPMPKMGLSIYPYGALINHLSYYVVPGLELVDDLANYDNWIAAGLLLDDLDTSLSAGGYNQGWQWNGVIESADLADNTLVTGNVLNQQFRYFYGMDNGHVIAQKLFVGLTLDGNSRFQLGGSASEAYIGPGFQFKQRDLSLRGFDDNLAELVGQNAAVYSAEYRLPFDWTDHAEMVPPIGLSGWSVRGFIDNGLVWDDQNTSDVYSGLGAELIFDGTLGYFLNLRFRLGAAKGLGSLGSDSVYLQLGGSF